VTSDHEQRGAVGDRAEVEGRREPERRYRDRREPGEVGGGRVGVQIHQIDPQGRQAGAREVGQVEGAVGRDPDVARVGQAVEVGQAAPRSRHLEEDAKRALVGGAVDAVERREGVGGAIALAADRAGQAGQAVGRAGAGLTDVGGAAGLAGAAQAVELAAQVAGAVGARRARAADRAAAGRGAHPVGRALQAEPAVAVGRAAPADADRARADADVGRAHQAGAAVVGLGARRAQAAVGAGRGRIVGAEQGAPGERGGGERSGDGQEQRTAHRRTPIDHDTPGAGGAGGRRVGARSITAAGRGGCVRSPVRP
jgi:hypothetical protein